MSNEETVNASGNDLALEIRDKSAPLSRLIQEVGRVIVGQETLIQRMLVAMISGGHLLIEGVPGLAKTTAVASLAKGISTDFQRLQFTPDLLPADLIGTRLSTAKSGICCSEGASFHEPRLGRRDQSSSCQGAERFVGGDAGTPGHDRFRNVPTKRPFHGDGDTEPGRTGGNLSLA